MVRRINVISSNMRCRCDAAAVRCCNVIMLRRSNEILDCSDVALRRYFNVTFRCVFDITLRNLRRRRNEISTKMRRRFFTSFRRRRET